MNTIPDSTIGLLGIWNSADSVSRSVAVLLLGMSVLSWYTIFRKWLDLRQHLQAATHCERFWASSGLDEGIRQLQHPGGNPFLRLTLAARQAADHIKAHESGQAPSSILKQGMGLSDWLSSSLDVALDDCRSKAQNGLTLLASTASTAPFIGLFGTVWGIYHALIQLSLSGGNTINQVAGPIGEALIMTAFGLLVAVPAVLGYNTFVRANKRTQQQLNRFAHDLHAFFVIGSRLRQGTTGTPEGSSATGTAVAPGTNPVRATGGLSA